MTLVPDARASTVGEHVSEQWVCAWAQLAGAGCADVTRTKRSCVFINSPSLGYFDRAVVQHNLTIAELDVKPTPDAVDGKLKAKEILPGQVTPLAIEFHLKKCAPKEGGMQLGERHCEE